MSSGDYAGCPFCFQLYNVKKRAERIKKRMVENALASTAKSKANGNKPGPKAKFNLEQILSLREQGASYREISKIIGCSHHTVAKYIVKMNKRGE